MAKISHSDLAPAEAVHYSIAIGEGGEFDLEGVDATFETDNRDAIANAMDHPWLKVTQDEPVVAEGEETAVVEELPHTAINAALDQKDAEYAGDIAETVAADAEQPDEPVVVETTEPEPRRVGPQE